MQSTNLRVLQEKRLGAGGFAVTFLLQNRDTGENVAGKFIPRGPQVIHHMGSADEILVKTYDFDQLVSDIVLSL